MGGSCSRAAGFEIKGREGGGGGGLDVRARVKEREDAVRAQGSTIVWAAAYVNAHLHPVLTGGAFVEALQLHMPRQGRLTRCSARPML